MQMKHNIFFQRKTPLALAGMALAVALSGCGGATNNTGILATPTSGPVVNGLSAADALNGTLFEISGLASANALTDPAHAVGYLSAPVASTAKPSAVIAGAFGGTIPLGFTPDGSFGAAGSNIGTAVLDGSSVIFGASISNGNDAKQPIPIDPSSVTLTSPDAAGFSQKLTFTLTANSAGPLATAQYTTPAFTLPFATPGLHSFVVSVADTSGQSSTTTFDVVTVNATTVALYAANITPDGAGGTPGTTPQPIAPGSVATITNPVAGARAQSTADGNGVVILFTTPGKQTFTVTPAGGTPVTQTIDLSAFAGKAFIE